MFIENNEVPSGVTYLEEPPSPEAQYRAFMGRSNRYAIYPDHWPWGQAPLLGIVVADSEFLAERVAYDRGILSATNCSFGPKIKLIQGGAQNQTSSTK